MSKEVIVRAINPTKKTVELTGLSSLAEIKAKKSTLFADYSESDLIQTYTNLHNGKIAEDKLEEFSKLSKEEMRDSLIKTLRFQLTVEQDAIRVDENGNITDSIVNNNPILAFGLRGSGYNTLSGTNKKVAWTTFDLFSIEDMGLTEKCNLTAIVAEGGLEVYVQRLTSFEPEKRDNRIVSSPKRLGKGGAILTKNGKMMYQASNIKLGESIDIEALEQQEAENIVNFKHDDVYPVEDTPVESKDSNGFFNQEFEAFLHREYVATTKGSMVKVA